MDGQINAASQVLCPFCGGRDRKINRRQVVADHRLLHHCTCEACGEGYVFAEDKSGHVSVRKR
jgi:hypothetical protein